MTEKTLHEKLEKILRLATHEGTSEEERDAAMARAQEIAFKHNIDLMEVNLSDDDAGGIFESNSRFMHEWESHLLIYCAEVNFCRVAHYKMRDGHKRRPHFVYGKKYNIDATYDLFHYLHMQVHQVEQIETGRRDKRLQYARKVLIEVVKELIPTQYMKRVIEENEAYFDAGMDASFLRPPDGSRYIDANHEALVEAAAMHLQGNDHLLKGTDGLIFIMDRTGLTASYASEIRPYLKRGEYAPEIVKNMGVWRKSFLLALVNRLGNRLYEKYIDLIDDAGSSGQELVRKEDAGLDEYGKDMGKEKEKKNTYDPRGLAAGARAAEGIKIDKYDSLTATEGRELNA